MTWLKAVAAEIFGLFVDSGSLAVAVLIWLTAVGLALPRLGLAPAYAGPLLFAGLAAILLHSVIRQARQG